MSLFYAYISEPEILLCYSEYSDEINDELMATMKGLESISSITYFFRKLFNRPHFKEKLILSNINEACNILLKRLKTDYEWAQKESYKTEIRICKHENDVHSISLFLAIRNLDAPETDGWILMEQVLIKKLHSFEIWRHEDEEDSE